MNRAFHLSTSRRAAGFAVKIGGATEFDDLSGGVLYDFVALDDVGVLQPNFAAWSKAEEFRRRCLHKIIALDVKLAVEGNFARAGAGVFRIINGLQCFGF